MKIESVVLVVFCISSYLWTEGVHSLGPLLVCFACISIICHSMCLHGLATCMVCSVCMVCKFAMFAWFAAVFAWFAVFVRFAVFAWFAGLKVCLVCSVCIFCSVCMVFRFACRGLHGLHGLHGLQCLLGLLWLLCLSFECSNSHDSVMNGRATWTSITVVSSSPEKPGEPHMCKL